MRALIDGSIRPKSSAHSCCWAAIMAGLALGAEDGCATATPVPPMAKERADINDCGLARAAVEATDRPMARESLLRRFVFIESPEFVLIHKQKVAYHRLDEFLARNSAQPVTVCSLV